MATNARLPGQLAIPVTPALCALAYFPRSGDRTSGMDDEHSTSRAPNTAANVPLPPDDDDDGTPWFTWFIGGAAVVVVLTAGALLFTTPGEDVTEAKAVETADDQDQDDKVAVPPQELAPRSPLDISDSLLDARQRAQLWRKDAALSSIRIVISAGKPLGGIEFDFGVPLGKPIPGTPMGAERVTYTYDGGVPQQKESQATDVGRVLPEPTCPIDVAYRKLGQTGVDTSTPLGAVYLHSSKHRRPIWTLTSGTTLYNVDADTCAMLRR